MSDKITLRLTRCGDGVVKKRLVRTSATELVFDCNQLVALPDNITELTHLSLLWLDDNAFAEVPACVLTMTQLTLLTMSLNRLVTLPPAIGRLRAMTHLNLQQNRLTSIPREIGDMQALEELVVSLLLLASPPTASLTLAAQLIINALTSVPSELCQLQSLQRLALDRNRIGFLPVSLDRLPATTKITFYSNPLPVDLSRPKKKTVNARSKLAEIFAATTHIAMLRNEATTMAIGLQDLELPALVTLEIIDAAFPNSIPMHKKWDLITAVKHYHQRRGN